MPGNTPPNKFNCKPKYSHSLLESSARENARSLSGCNENGFFSSLRRHRGRVGAGNFCRVLGEAAEEVVHPVSRQNVKLNQMKNSN